MSGSDANFFDSKLSKLAEAKERALAQPAGPEQRKIPDDPYYELGVQDGTIKELRRQLAEIEAVVDQPARHFWWAMGTKPETEEDIYNMEARLAKAIYSAMKDSDPTAMIQGEPESCRTLIDGTFNLQTVAKLVLYDLRDSRDFEV